MKKLLYSLLILTTSVVWSQTATVNLNTERQLIRGFGGMNHPVWIGDLTEHQREVAFGNGPDQLGMTVLRMWISDNPNQWHQEIETALRAQEMGALIFASPWNPPEHMVETFTRNGEPDQRRLRHDMYGAYVDHLNDFIAFMESNGVNLHAVSMQNEPDYAHGWTWWTPEEVLHFMRDYAGDINSRVIAPESFQYRKDISDPILNDPQALENLDILGAHLYGTQVSNFPYPLFEENGQGKELWMTEVYHPNSEWDSNELWPEAMETAHNIHNAMVEGNFQMYVWWYIRRSYSPMNEDGTISKRGHVMSHYSKFVRPGYHRIEATKNPAADVYVSAYKNDEDDVAIVLLNRSNQNRTITVSVPETAIEEWERYVTSGSKSLDQETNINAGGTSFEVTLEPQSITTLNGSMSAGLPTISITSPDDNEVFISPANITLQAAASVADGNISHVTFFNGDEELASVNSAPYTFEWEDVAAGSYEIRTVATDSEGHTAEDQINITVNVPQGPYNEVPQSIPGIVQAQEYDVGGHGFAYFDVNPDENLGGAFRPDEGVDIGGPEDEGDHESYFVGWVEDGEWIEYTVNVAQSGTYHITYRLASGGNGAFDLSFDGHVVDQIETPSTTNNPEAWWEDYNYTDVVTENIELEAGEQIMRLDISTGGFNLNYISFEYQPAAPELSTITEDFTVIDGGEATFEVTASGSAPFTYQWYFNGDPIDGADQSTYTIPSVSAADQGDYHVVITNNEGSVTSDPVSLTVTIQEPYLGEPLAIPGTIQAQHFDLGGQGLAYWDATEENEGGDYRPDEWVGIEENDDGDGEYHIGWIEAEEWIEYTVEVAEAGDYDITYRVASGGNGEFALLFDGMQVGQIQTPSTTNNSEAWWEDYDFTDVVSESVTLEAGEQVMRVEVIEGGFNLNYISFAPSVVTSTEREEHASIQCYPNPSSDAFHLEVDGAFYYNITNVNGSVVKAGKADGQAFTGHELAPGIYHIQIITTENTQTFKAIKY